MRTSQYLLSTVRETPSDAVVISHQLMLRAGMIRRLASGLYTWLPTGLRVLRKVEGIIRDEMNKAGVLELMMPVVQPSELWHETGRWNQYGPELLRITDRHSNSFCLGPTHEEVITDLVRNEIHSYKQLPISFYQVQTKFRDEIRPRFGVMRSREFIMKDAYSFHSNQESLQETYDRMHQAYCNIFSRIGLNFRPVQADTGSIGGNNSHEFHVLADSGEDDIAFSDQSDYAANIEKSEAMAPPVPERPSTSTKTTVDTPKQHSIEEVATHLHVESNTVVKTLIVLGKEDEQGDQPLVALVVRGDHSLNEIKAEKLPQVSAPLTFASEEQVSAALDCNTGSIGPVGLTIDVLVDHSAFALLNFVCGANNNDQHLTNVNWDVDAQATLVCDIRNVVAGDPSPDGKGQLTIKRGIEVGHIFQLGTKYSEALNASVLGDQGKPIVMPMGCYGIGVTRVVAAAIEQNHDDSGIIWPQSIAPFQVAIVPLKIKKSAVERELSEKLYQQLTGAGVEVLFDDREKESSGVKFKDTELLGIPHRITVTEKAAERNCVEYKGRKGSEKQEIEINDILGFIQKSISEK